MALKEKLIVKFTRLMPFVIMLIIGVGIVESVHSYYFNKSLDLYDANGEYLFTMYTTPASDVLNYVVYYCFLAMLLMLSQRLDFCNYHKIPIYFIIMNFAVMQLHDLCLFGSANYYIFYFSILFILLVSIGLSVYLYQHKKPHKR